MKLFFYNATYTLIPIQSNNMTKLLKYLITILLYYIKVISNYFIKLFLIEKIKYSMTILLNCVKKN